MQLKVRETMRKILVLMLSLILILSGLLYVNVKVLEDSGLVFEEYFESEAFISDMRNQMGIDEFVESVPFYQEELFGVVDKIEKSPETKALAQTYSRMIMTDIIKDTYSFAADDFINYILDSFEKHLAQNDNLILDSLFQLFKPFINENVDQLNLESYYKLIVDDKKNAFSDAQLKSMKVIYYFYENIEAYKKASLITMAISFGLLMILSLRTLFRSLNTLLALNMFSLLFSAYMVKTKGYPIENRAYFIFSVMLVLLNVFVRLLKQKKTA